MSAECDVKAVNYIVIGDLVYDKEKNSGRGPYYGGFETYEEALEFVKKKNDDTLQILGPRMQTEKEDSQNSQLP